ncbi:MAG: hypothetical protein L6Q57_02115 [Alphaproteobacteria bacterium]|nr:hypothetical protein [Alphaproteobacteria bacterium]
MKRFYILLALAVFLATVSMVNVWAEVPVLGNPSGPSGSADFEKRVNPQATYNSCCPSDCPPLYAKVSTGFFGYTSYGLYVLLECKYVGYYECSNYGGYMASNDSTVTGSQTVLAQASDKASDLISKRLARIAKS